MILPNQSPAVAAPSQTPPPITPPNDTPPPKKDSQFVKISKLIQDFFVVTLTFGVIYANRDNLSHCRCEKCNIGFTALLIGMMYATYSASQCATALADKAFDYFHPKKQ